MSVNKLPFYLCILLLVNLTVLLSGTAHAQVEVTTGADSSAVATPRTPTVEDSLRRTERLFGHRVTRPAKAAYLSLMFPGLGQIYNKQYWKLPLVYGAVGATGYLEYYYQSRYRQFVNGYNAITSTPPREDTGEESSKFATVEGKQRGIVFYRSYRDQFIAFTLLAYGMNVLDALVAAHLHDFDISDDLSMRWGPTMMFVPTAMFTPGLSLSLQLSPTRSSHK